jgi:hypothetical protein
VHAASSMVAENQDLFPSRPALALKTLPIALHAPHLETKTLVAGNSEEDTWHVDRHQQQDLTEAGTDRKTEKCFLTHYKPTGRRAHPRAPFSTAKQPIRPPCNPEQPRPRTYPPTRQREPPAQCHRTEQHPIVYVPTRLPSGRSLLRQKQRTQARARASRLALGPCTAHSYGKCAPALHTATRLRSAPPVSLSGRWYAKRPDVRRPARLRAGHKPDRRPSLPRTTASGCFIYTDPSFINTTPTVRRVLSLARF